MNGDRLHPIGEAARRSGLTVKAVRFYADRGLAPPVDRDASGRRRYDDAAIARLGLVRTLRALGLDLATVEQVLERRVSVPEAATRNADALAEQARALRRRRAILLAVAARADSAEQIAAAHELATLPASERRRLSQDFLAVVFDGLSADPAFAGVMRSLTPQLPEDPEPEQIEAWIELAGLVADPDFRASLRRLARRHAADRGRAAAVGPLRDFVAAARDRVEPALAAGVDPTSAAADAVVSGLVDDYTRGQGGGDADATPPWRLMLAHLETANDPRRERYLRLLAVVNGWAAPSSLTPALDWSVAALRARLAEG